MPRRKSAFAGALGNETGRPTLTLEIGALYGSLVGATEQNIRQALRVADAMAPCIRDSGVSTRLFGSLLTWLADHETDVFFVGTANNISQLPPEFTRAEQLDVVFVLDFPGVQEKRAIWQFYVEPLRPRSSTGPAGRRRVHRGGDQGLLSPGSPLGRLAR